MARLAAPTAHARSAKGERDPTRVQRPLGGPRQRVVPQRHRRESASGKRGRYHCFFQGIAVYAACI